MCALGLLNKNDSELRVKAVIICSCMSAVLLGNRHSGKGALLVYGMDHHIE